ncbi:MAG: 2-oxoacid:acceptor oxidoreductase family protein [Victivallaceae bacterium]|nr:2-oxoacid:acceptor oxidoreductase family protein [Victivallaceae bacterium]
MKTVNITFAGLGGQGVLTATDVLAAAAFSAGLDVKKSEVHGMSQRGGSVSSEVRYGEKVASPMIPAGESDFLVVTDAAQVDVNRGKLKSGGVLITPEMIDIAGLGNKKALNIALLGLLSTYLDFLGETWKAALAGELPAKLHEVNFAAFELGKRSR